MLEEFKSDQSFVEKRNSQTFVCGKSESPLMKQSPTNDVQQVIPKIKNNFFKF